MCVSSKFLRDFGDPGHSGELGDFLVPLMDSLFSLVTAKLIEARVMPQF